MFRQIDAIIVGGCFPVQHNIEEPKLYHHLLKRKLGQEKNIVFKIRTVRYERLTKCLKKIRLETNKQKPDWIIFHIRAEPILRLSKFYYKYRDSKGKLIRSFNVSLFNIEQPEKHNISLNRQITFTTTDYQREETKLHHYLRELNYLIGFLIGNVQFSFQHCLDLVNEVGRFSSERNIKILFTGPVSRPHTFFENLLSYKLSRYIESAILGANVIFVNCLGEVSGTNRALFFDDGVHVNEEGHSRIANLIWDKIIQYELTNDVCNIIANVP